MTRARLEFRHEGRVARVILAAPKANVLDATMVSELDRIFASLERQTNLHAIVLEAEGPHFSFGASVEEHLPEQIEGALARLGALLRRVAAAPAPTIAAVRGQCLGGGFELVLACDLVVAEESAQLGVPEIKLGVFPPAASALLPVRIGVAGAAAMVLTGTSWSGMLAMEQGLVARLAPPDGLEQTLDGFVEEVFLPRTATAVRYAARAVRLRIARALVEDLPELDRLYLQGLMREPGAADGILAFLKRRS